jgi:hypothetical protein
MPSNSKRDLPPADSSPINSKAYVAPAFGRGNVSAVENLQTFDQAVVHNGRHYLFLSRGLDASQWRENMLHLIAAHLLAGHGATAASGSGKAAAGCHGTSSRAVEKIAKEAFSKAIEDRTSNGSSNKKRDCKT